MELTLHEVSRKIHRVNLLHRIRVQSLAFEKGMNFTQLPLLEYVVHHDGCTQRELCEFLQVSPPSVAMSVKRMQKAGLICKSVDESDLRCTRVSVTEKGQAYAKQFRALFDAVDEQMFLGFSKEEIETVAGYVARMGTNLDSEGLFEASFSVIKEREKHLFKKFIKGDEDDA